MKNTGKIHIELNNIESLKTAIGKIKEAAGQFKYAAHECSKFNKAIEELKRTLPHVGVDIAAGKDISVYSEFIFKNNGIFFNRSLSKAEFNKLKHLPMAKKSRLPRKLKKRLNKGL
jgi:hypothetical protein